MSGLPSVRPPRAASGGQGGDGVRTGEPAEVARANPRGPAQIALTAGAIAGLGCLLLALAALLFGVRPLLFRSGSMEPAIGTGAVALARTVDATELAPGDVVSVTNEAGERVTHRVVAVDAVAGNTATLRLKGDANESADAQPYLVTSAERVFFHVEKLGHAVAWLASPAAVFLGGAFAGVLLTIAFRPRRAAPRPGRHAAGLVVVAVLVAAGGVGRAPEAQAQTAATDAAAATSGAFSSRTEFVPRIDQPFGNGSYVTCAKRVASGPDPVDLTWRHLGPPYRYRLVLRDAQPLGGNAVWRTWDVTGVPPNAGDTVSYTITGAGLPPRLALPYLYDLEVHTVLPGPPVSSGAVGTAWRGVGLQQALLGGLLVPEDLFCGVLRGEQSGAPAYTPGPASLSCADQAPRVVLSWPHLGPPYSYTLTLREGGNRNTIGNARTVDPGATPAGQPVSTAVAVADTGTTATAVIAEIRAVNGASTSTEFVQQNLTVTSTAVACATAGIRARTATPSTTGTPTTATSPAPGTTATTTPDATTTPVPLPAPATPAPAPAPEAPAPTTTPAPPAPAAPPAPPTTTTATTTTTPAPATG